MLFGQRSLWRVWPPKMDVNNRATLMVKFLRYKSKNSTTLGVLIAYAFFKLIAVVDHLHNYTRLNMLSSTYNQGIDGEAFRTFSNQSVSASVSIDCRW